MGRYWNLPYLRSTLNEPVDGHRQMRRAGRDGAGTEPEKRGVFVTKCPPFKGGAAALEVGRVTAMCPTSDDLDASRRGVDARRKRGFSSRKAHALGSPPARALVDKTLNFFQQLGVDRDLELHYRILALARLHHEERSALL